MPAYDALALRIRAAYAGRPEIVEKKMFGGLGFMLSGNMMAGVTGKGELMVRVAPDGGEEALARGAHPLSMGERTMKGFMGVSADAVASDAALGEWLAWSERYVRTLPPK